MPLHQPDVLAALAVGVAVDRPTAVASASHGRVSHTQGLSRLAVVSMTVSAAVHERALPVVCVGEFLNQLVDNARRAIYGPSQPMS